MTDRRADVGYTIKTKLTVCYRPREVRWRDSWITHLRLIQGTECLIIILCIIIISMCHYNRDKLSVKYSAISTIVTQTHRPHASNKTQEGKTSHSNNQKYVWWNKKTRKCRYQWWTIVNCTHGWQFEVRALRWAFKKADKKYHKQYTYSFKLLGNLPQYLKA